MKIKKVTTTRYVGEDGFEFTFEPIEDTLKIKETPEGFEARYLVRDSDGDADDLICEDDDLFPVNYHRDFEIKRDKIITKDTVVDIYRGNDTEHVLDIKKQYWIFPMSMLSHSGVWLSLGSGFACDGGGWDTSHVGLLLVSKREWKTRELALKAATAHIGEWNCVLSGDVYGCVAEFYDKSKKQLDQESCWRFIGLKYALEELENFRG